MADTTLDISTKKAIDELRALQAEIVKTGNVTQDTQKGMAAAQEQTNKQIKEQTKTVADLKNEYLGLEKSGAAVEGLSDSVGGLGEETNKASTAVGGLGSRIKASVSNIQVAGKSLGEWKEQIGGVASGLLNGVKASGVFQGAIRGIGIAIKATGIGLLLGVVASLIQYFRTFQSGMDTFARVTAGAGAVVDVLVKRFLSLGSAIIDTGKGIFNFGKAIVQFATFDFAGGIDSWKESMTNFDTATDSAAASVNGLTKELLFAAQAAAQLEKDRQALRDFVQDIQKRTAQREVDAAAARRIADDENKGINARLGALRLEGNLKKGIAEDELKAALERQRIAKAEVRRTPDNADAIQEAESAAIDVIKARGKVQEEVFETEKAQRELRKQAAAEREKQVKKERDELDALKKDIEKLRVEGTQEGIDKDLAEVNRKYNALAETAKSGVEKLSEIEKRRGLTPEEQAQRDEFARFSVELEERRTEALLDVLTDYAEKDIAIEKELREQKEALAKGDYERTVESLEREKGLREQQIAIGEESAKAFILRLKEQGAKKEEIEAAQREFELLAQQARLRTELEFQEKLLEATAQFAPERAEQIKKQIELLKAQLGNIDFEIQTPEKKKPFDLLEFLGVDAESQDEFKDAVSKIVDGLKQISQARVDAARAAVEEAEKQVEVAENAVDAAEERLEREIEIAKTGEANNLALRQSELAAAEKQAADAKKIRDDAIKEQQKAARAQLVLDTVVQVSGLITAAANTFKTWSSVPFVGIVLAAAQIASMIALFASTKAKAKALSAQKLKHGGEVESRDRVAGQPDSDGEILVRATPGEFVTNKKQSQRHRALLEAINVGDTPKMAVYLEAMKTGARRDTDATGGAASPSVSVNVNSTDPKLQKLMRENNVLQKKIYDLEKNRSQAYDMGSHILKIKGGRRERIKKQGQR